MFLETISFLGNDLLMPIDRIRTINLSYTTGWEIKIRCDEDIEAVECFGGDEKKARKRYEMIKEIVQGK